MFGARSVKDLDCTQLTGKFAEMHCLDEIQAGQHSLKADSEVK